MSRAEKLCENNISPTKTVAQKRTRIESSQNQFQKTQRILQTLQDLIPLWPQQVNLSETHAKKDLLKKIRQILKAEQSRALNGHWTYSFARHTQLLRAFHAIDQLPERTEALPHRNAKTVNRKGPLQNTTPPQHQE